MLLNRITDFNMQNTDRDYNNILKCLSIQPTGIECLRDDESYLKSLLPFFAKIQPTARRPDAFSINDDTVLLLEHFQFDNSKVTSKGSSQNQISANTNRKFDNLLKKDKDFAVINEVVDKSGSFYVENFYKQFNAHSKNIEAYKSEIQNQVSRPLNTFIMGFIIEDSSPLGSVFFDNGIKCLDLVYTKEFLDLFEKTTNLDFVVFAMTGNSDNQILSFISHRTINEHRKNQVEASKIQKFFFENSICMSGLYLIPTKKI